MLSLSPAKLLVILVIALIVLGPEKLPQVARQIGAAWHDLRQWRSRIESEVRGTFPNLPPTHEVAQAVRSPLAFLDRLADEHEAALEADDEDASDDGADADAADRVASGPPPQTASPAGSARTDRPGPLGDGGRQRDRRRRCGGQRFAVGGRRRRARGRRAPRPAPPVAPGAFPAVPDDPSMN